MKTCFKCLRSLPLGDFYRHPRMADGHLGKCKDCTKQDSRDSYRASLDMKRAYYKSRQKTPERKRWMVENQRKRRANHPEKDKARAAVTRALRSGALVRTPCEKCGAAPAEAHHQDYSKHLDVMWLCRPCHRAIHGNPIIQKKDQAA